MLCTMILFFDASWMNFFSSAPALAQRRRGKAQLSRRQIIVCWAQQVFE